MEMLVNLSLKGENKIVIKYETLERKLVKESVRGGIVRR